MSETIAPAGKAPKFKNGANEMRHPVLGIITNLHLENPIVLKAIDKMDERKETKEWRKQHING